MVSIAPFLKDVDLILKEIQKRENDAERNRRREFLAVRNIQRWVRGFLERRHIEHLNEAAKTIQKTWRGYRGRKKYMNLLREKVDKMCTDYYNDMASRVQKYWRGHVVRSRIYNHYTLKRWLKLVLLKNDELLRDTKKFRQNIEDARIDALESEARDWVLFILFKIHHLIRTQGVPGIYSRLDSNELSVLEEQLKELRFMEYVDVLHKQRKALRMKFENYQAGLHLPKEIRHHKCEEYWYKRIRVNKPTLLAQEKYTELWKQYQNQSLQRNWMSQMEKRSMRFPKVQHDDRHLLLDRGPYTQHYMPLRDAKPSKQISAKDFSTVFQRIELFDQLKSFDYFGPYKPDISETDLFINRFRDKCYTETSSESSN